MASLTDELFFDRASVADLIAFLIVLGVVGRIRTIVDVIEHAIMVSILGIGLGAGLVYFHRGARSAEAMLEAMFARARALATDGDVAAMADGSLGKLMRDVLSATWQKGHSKDGEKEAY